MMTMINIRNERQRVLNMLLAKFYHYIVSHLIRQLWMMKICSKTFGTHTSIHACAQDTDIHHLWKSRRACIHENAFTFIVEISIKRNGLGEYSEKKCELQRNYVSSISYTSNIFIFYCIFFSIYFPGKQSYHLRSSQSKGQILVQRDVKWFWRYSTIFCRPKCTRILIRMIVSGVRVFFCEIYAFKRSITINAH